MRPRRTSGRTVAAGRDRAARAYRRFLPHQFLKLLGKASISDIRLGANVERNMTILFSDIRDFTSLSESMALRENFRFISAYLKEMEPILFQSHGFIDKYTGDAPPRPYTSRTPRIASSPALIRNRLRSTVIACVQPASAEFETIAASNNRSLNMGSGKFLTWQVGKVKITRVAELGGAPFPGSFMFPEARPELVRRHAWLRPHFAHEDGRLFGSIHSFVIESRGRRIIVDTCVGNDKARSIEAWNLLQGPFLADLALAGFPAESIDTVLCTHLHVDHVGWNTRLIEGKWVPTFPNARYLFGRREWDHWSSAAAKLRDGAVMGDSVRPIIDAGLAELVDMDHTLTSEVRLEPTPGHTPGHVSVRICSRGDEAVITGDLMHHPLQCAEPDLANNFDVDAAAARRTRRDFLSRCADQPVLVLGTHFAPPTGGWVVTAAPAWRFELSAPADNGKP